ncbi:MAG: hypothetical protein AB1476_01075 [Candidatus Hadarchaeota archaeon]
MKKDGQTLNSVLSTAEKILGLPQSDVRKAGELWKKLDGQLELIEAALRADGPRHARLMSVATSLRLSASKLARSISCSRGGGRLRSDWERLAACDLTELKDELLALKEFLSEEAEFIRFALARAQLLLSDACDPEALFRELHAAGAISERTWALLMAYPDSWRKTVKSREVSAQLRQISRWFLDLQEVRAGQNGVTTP